MPIESIPETPKIYDIDAARKAGVSEEGILGALKSRFGKLYDYDGALKAGVQPADINNTVVGKINDPTGPNRFDILKQGLTNAKDKIIDLVKPVADSASTILGAAAGSTLGPVGSVVGGAGAGIATDAFLQELQSATAQHENRTALSKTLGTKEGSASDTALNAVQNEGLNELLGKVFTTVGGKVKSLLTPVGENGIQELQPTFSQYNGSKLASMVENIWTPTAKADAMQESANLARNKFGSLLAEPETPGDRFNIGKLNRSFENGKSKAETIGRMNQIDVPVENPTLPSGNVNPFPSGATRPVEGPVFLKRTADEAQAFLADREKFAQSGDFKGFTDDDKKLIQTSKEIIQHTNGGKDPIPFKTALSLLHGEGGNAGIETVSSLKPGELSPTKDILGNIGDSLHRDIQDSLGNWKLGGDEALEGYNNARVAALTKQTLADGGNVQNLINSTNGPIPQIDKALQNPSQTQKLLNTSNLEGVKSTNMRQDLAGYRLQQIWSKADSGTGLIDGNKLVAEWNNPDFAATKDQLYSKQSQEQIGQFFDNVSKVSQNGMGGNYGQVRLGYHGIALASSLFTGNLTGHALGSFAAMEIPPYALAKLFTNPAKAQILQRLVANEPLEMSTQQAGRLLMSGLNGVTVSLVDGDGKRKDVTIRDGKVQ